MFSYASIDIDNTIATLIHVAILFEKKGGYFDSGFGY